MKKGILVFMSIALLFAASVFIFIHVCRIKKFTVSGSDRYTSDQIREAIDITRYDDIAPLLYIKSKFKSHVYIPFIEQYDVEMDGADGIRVTLYDKLVTGCAEIMGEYMYFDSDGYIVESSPALLDKIPVITGLKFDSIVLGKKLPVENSKIFNKILTISKLVTKNSLPVMCIDFDENMEVTLTLSNKSEIYFGNNDSLDEQMSVLKSVIESYNEPELYIDMSTYSEDNTKIIARPLNGTKVDK